MAQPMDHITYLSKEIGPRPAGTEEEQNASLYITEQFQKETGFATSMEDFSSSSNVEIGLAAMAGIAVLATLLAMIFPVLSIPAFILATAAAVLYTLEELDKPIISRVLARGASQNVVAKYIPSADAEAPVVRRGATRKIILLAHYDTGNVTPPVIERVEKTRIPIALVCAAGIIAAAFFLLIRIFVASGGGMGLLILNILSTIALLVCLYPIAKAALLRTSPYNEGATNNATGTAALIEIARRIARGSVSEAELADVEEGVVIHGEEAAREAGLIPEGVKIIYEAEEVVEPVVEETEEEDEEERLLSAKAAIAALTGRPVENKIYGTVTSSRTTKEPEDAPQRMEESQAEHLEDYRGENESAEMMQTPETFVDTGVPTYAGFEPLESVDGFENAPGWFVAAQQNARRPENENEGAPQIKRSRYTEAIENAERNLAEREEEIKAAERAAREAAQRAHEEELRAALAAREAEHAAALKKAAAEREAQEQALAQSAAPAVEVMDQSAPVQTILPDSTAAFTMHTPAAEIVAEALAAEASDGRLQEDSYEAAEPADHEEAANEPRVNLDASAIPIPPQDQTAHSRISALPSIDPSDPYSDKEEKKSANLANQVPSVADIPEVNAPKTAEPSRSGILRKLRTNIPSLSGLISPASTSAERSAPSTASDKVDYGMEVNLENPAQDRNLATASRSSVDIPRSRSGSLLNKLRNDGEEPLTDTPQQWLEVEDDFDPRAAGRERGGWESFRRDQIPPINPAEESESEQGPTRRWQGGAYSRVQLGHVDTRSGEDTEADKPIAEEVIEPEIEKPIAEEIEQIYHFRNPMFNTEIWFVAVGSDGISHDGARAFIDEHRDELRGAIMIEIESLGAGELSLATEEGRIRKTSVSSRAKRSIRAATAETGVAVESVSLAGADSITSTLQKAGFQAMHLFGAEDGRPALKGSADDVVENIDEVLLDEHIGFVYELLKR